MERSESNSATVTPTTVTAHFLEKPMTSSPTSQPHPDGSATPSPQEAAARAAAGGAPQAAQAPEPVVAHQQKRPPSPPWYGGILVGSIGLMAAILLTYTLLDWQWQQDLGAWNYVAAVLLIPITTAFMLTWQPDETL
jgi:hypothetical protein